MPLIVDRYGFGGTKGRSSPPSPFYRLSTVKVRSPAVPGSAPAALNCCAGSADKVWEVQGARLPDPSRGPRPGEETGGKLSRQTGFQSSAEGTRSARLKRELAFSHAISIVSSAICSSS